MYSFEPKDLPVPQVHQHLLGGVAPRPIAFVSTVSQDGVNNLSPFSFFNAFGANPPIVVFSAARRGTNATVKDTYNNLMASKECVIHTVTHSMVEQVNLASCEYPPNVDEFLKAGFTPLKSDLVKPMRVKESPFHMECRLVDMIETGGGAASGNLAICEVIKFHIAGEIMRDGRIDPHLLDAVARNGGNFYTRANGSALFEVTKPGSIKGIGIDSLPERVRNSDVFTGNNLALLALIDAIPDKAAALLWAEALPEAEASRTAFDVAERTGDYELMFRVALSLQKESYPKSANLIERAAKKALDHNQRDIAWNMVWWWME